MTPDPKLSKEIEAALARYRDKPGTASTYHQGISRFLTCASLDSLAELKKLRPARAEGIVEDLLVTFSPATVATTIAAMKRLFKHLLRRELIKSSPLGAIDLPRVKNVPEWNVLKPGEEKKYLDAVRAGGSKRDLAVVLALLLQGWRVSTLCKLTWGDLGKHKGKTIVSFVGKGDKVAVRVVKPEVLKAAEAWAHGTAPDQPFIAASHDHQPFAAPALTRQDVHRIITHYARQALDHKLTPHGLRATFVSKTIAERGIEVARQLAGHENIATTQRYNRFQVIE